jgi:hypothetical protein
VRISTVCRLPSSAPALALLCVAGLGYIFPSIVAFSRRHPNRWLTLVINVAGGLTVFGWLLSLVWACRAIHKSDSGSDGGESGLNIFANDEQKMALVNQKDAASQLADLKNLLDRGAISASEFGHLKQQIMTQSGY